MTPREMLAPLLAQVADEHMIELGMIKGRSILPEVVIARYAYIQRVHQAFGHSRSHTSRVTGFDRKTVRKALDIES